MVAWFVAWERELDKCTMKAVTSHRTLNTSRCFNRPLLQLCLDFVDHFFELTAVFDVAVVDVFVVGFH